MATARTKQHAADRDSQPERRLRKDHGRDESRCMVCRRRQTSRAEGSRSPGVGDTVAAQALGRRSGNTRHHRFREGDFRDTHLAAARAVALLGCRGRYTGRSRQPALPRGDARRSRHPRTRDAVRDRHPRHGEMYCRSAADREDPAVRRAHRHHRQPCARQYESVAATDALPRLARDSARCDAARQSELRPFGGVRSRARGDAALAGLAACRRCGGAGLLERCLSVPRQRRRAGRRPGYWLSSGFQDWRTCSAQFW